MDLNALLNRFAEAGVPTDSAVAAGVHANRNLLDVNDAANLIRELDPNAEALGRDDRFVQLTAAYVIMLTVRSHLEAATVEGVNLVREATSSASRLIDDEAWMFVGEENTKAEVENADPEVVKAGKAKKGARKVLALRIYNEKIKARVEAKEMTRKEAIAVLMEDVGLSAAGASTYYANFKSGKWS